MRGLLRLIEPGSDHSPCLFLVGDMWQFWITGSFKKIPDASDYKDDVQERWVRTAFLFDRRESKWYVFGLRSFYKP